MALKLIFVPSFSLNGGRSRVWPVINCHQLSTAVDRWWQLLTEYDSCRENILNEIFINTLKLIFVPNFRSLGWFSLSSAFISCQQLLTADNTCYEKKFNVILIHTLKVLCVIIFSSLWWFSFSSAVNSCYQLLTAENSCYKKK